MEREEVYELFNKAFTYLNVDKNYNSLGSFKVENFNIISDNSHSQLLNELLEDYIEKRKIHKQLPDPVESWLGIALKRIILNLKRDPYYYTGWKILITDEGSVDIYIGLENDRHISLSRFTYVHMIHLSPERVTRKNILTAIQSLIFFLKNKDYVLRLYRKAKSKPHHLLCWDIKYYSKLVSKRKAGSRSYDVYIDDLYNSTKA